MKSLILYTAANLLLPVMLLFSLFLLLRGHDAPGGGFVGGLVAAAAFALHAIAFSATSARNLLRPDPQTIIGLGLLAALVGGIAPLFIDEPFLTGHWYDLDVRGLGVFSLGTPKSFDFGVYLVVVGAALLIIFSLQEE